MTFSSLGGPSDGPKKKLVADFTLDELVAELDARRALEQSPDLGRARALVDRAEAARSPEYRSAIYRAARKLSFVDVCSLGNDAVETFLDVVMAGEG